ncbi:MAG: efflux RND transporter periplasmic adaptor subunit [bacterium]
MVASIFKNKIITSLFLIILIGFGSYFLIKKKNSKQQITFKSEKPLIKDITQWVDATGTLEAKDEITIGSLVAGKVEKILVEDNDTVKKDQILTILDDGVGDSAVKSLKGVVDQANAYLKYQTAYYKRQKQLYESGQLSKNAFEEIEQGYEVAKGKLAQAEGELEIRQKEYNNLWIKSPDNGIVISKKVDLGQMITSRLQATVLFLIAKNLHEMEANVAVDEADVGLVKEGQDAVFSVDAFPKKIFKAKVRQIRYKAEIIDNVVTYATILDVKNPKLRLRPGMTTSVNIKVIEAKDAVVVHNKVFRINKQSLKQTAKALGYDIAMQPEIKDKISQTEKPTLWILEDKTFKQVIVETGAVEGRYTQILSGIDKSTDIITEVTDFTDKKDMLIKIFKGAGGGIGK